MTTRTFGVAEDGTLTVCRAKPENRGKGRCKHSEHIELTTEDLRSGFIQSHNEDVLRTLYAKAGVDALGKISRRALIEATNPKPADDYEMAELREASDKVAEQISDRDFRLVQEFYRKYERFTAPEVWHNDTETLPTEKVQRYLESDEPTVVKLREYLGDVSLKDVSDILLLEVGAMTNAYEWSSGSRSSVPRAYLSTLKNDMDKQNYVASVLFFRGRCCYCDRSLSRDGALAEQPTGEHITPVKPESDSAIVGGTRFGNMALACQRCNSDRGNKDLHSWINGTPYVAREQKPIALGRIQAFRSFAKYEEYTQEKSDLIRERIARTQKEIAALRAADGKFPRDRTTYIRDLIAGDIEELSDGNVYPVTFAWYE